MEQKWKKRYSFRLKSGDNELYELLAGSKRSETIRQMLLFACRTMAEEKQKAEDYEALWKELRIMQEVGEKRHQELLKQLTDKSPILPQEEVPIRDEQDENRLSEKALNDSAAAMITSFGMNE